jgi:hypothetical protein
LGVEATHSEMPPFVRLVVNIERTIMAEHIVAVFDSEGGAEGAGADWWAGKSTAIL